MSLTAAISSVLSKVARLDGRASLAEFWKWTLFVGIVYGAMLLLAAVTTSVALYYLALVLVLVAGLPSISLAIRRLHDIGRSGWWYLLILVPVADLALLYLWARSGDPDENRFGPPPDGAPVAVQRRADQPPPRDQAPVLLERLQELYDRGAITRAQFDESRRALQDEVAP